MSDSQRAGPGPPAVLPRMAVATPTPWQPQVTSWSSNSSMAAPLPQGYSYEEQQASESQDSSGQFRFLPGQHSSQDSQSTPSLSNRSVPKFLQDSWARGEPQPGPQRQPPPPPPLPPGKTVTFATTGHKLVAPDDEADYQNALSSNAYCNSSVVMCRSPNSSGYTLSTHPDFCSWKCI